MGAEGSNTAPPPGAGEDGLVIRYLAPLARRMPGALGLSDDCAIIAPPPGLDLVVTTDPIAAGVHFFADDAPADIAWKALAVNVLDLAAKGARPFGYVMALSFPEAPSHAWMQAFAQGLEAAQEAFGIGLLGGDTDRRPGPLTISITALGTVESGQAVLRSGAKPGDIVFVSGSIGDGTLGLAIRGGDPSLPRHMLTPAGAEMLLRRYLDPQPRLALAQALCAYASAAMDVSDGLIKDLGRLCRVSHLQARVRLGDVPLSAPAQMLAEADAGVLVRLVTGGDDYEVLCTAAPGHAAPLLEAAAAAGVPLTAIGVTEAGSGGVALIGRDGAGVVLERPGYDHF